ncbi:GIY-YIG nuclease family protein [Candidatus Collierbacteria bacterium]|nr:GIY-YIG nuclease family protein [Candidatus Collierbacteria bacterium]
MPFFYTYVIQSQINYKLYIGWTNDLQKRLNKHNSGLVFATKPGLPWKLVYFEGCLSKIKAISREKTLKSGFGRKYVKSRI